MLEANTSWAHNILFKRGFLLVKPSYSTTRQLDEWLRSWYTQEVGAYHLRYHPLWQYNCSKGEIFTVHCLGIICDVFSNGKSDSSVVNELAGALNNGWGDFYQKLKHTGGTYILFIEKDSQIFVLLDAVGTVTACHGTSDNNTLVASHPRLIAEIKGQEMSEWAREWINDPLINRGGRYLPGLLTPYDGVEYITPNQRFDVARRQMSRFYPDGEIQERDPGNIIAAVAPALKSQLERLVSHNYKLAFSLSGGMDSRLTLAASRSIKQCSTYFTYYSLNNPVLRMDIEVARDLKDRLDLQHVEMRFGEKAPPAEFKHQYQITTDGVQGSVETVYMLHHYFGEKFIHIRSNVLETIRGFYLKNPINHKNEFTARKLSRLFRNATDTKFENAFEDFIQKCSFNKERLFNFHYSDLFYWEHRLAAWLGPMIRGNRVALDTYIIYNSRVLLELMMSRPLLERNQAKLVFGLMERLWPEVLNVRIFSGSKFITTKFGDDRNCSSRSI